MQVGVGAQAGASASRGGLHEWVIGHPGAVRCGGLAGSLALGADAYLFGAKPVMSALVTPQQVATGPHGALIMALWLAGTALLAAAWWAGRHLVGTVTTRWIVVTAVLWMIPMLVVPPLESRDVYSYACQGALYAGGGDSYHQGVSSLPCPWLSSVSRAWRDTPTPYGPLQIMLSGLASQLGSLGAAITALRAYAVVGVALIGFSLPPIARRIGVPPDRALWLVLACPMVSVDLVAGAHNDALTMGLLVAGMAILVTRYGTMAGWAGGGALAGLSLAMKPTQLVVLPFLVLYAAGGRDAPAGAGADTAAAAAPDAGLLGAGPLGAGPLGAGPLGAGPLGFPPIRDVVRRGGPLLAAALLALAIPTLASGLGFGWAEALVNAKVEEAWTAPSTALATTIDAVAGLFGAHVHLVDPVRTVFLVLFVAALVGAFWRARFDGRIYAMGIALLAISFFAPSTQPWYLFWPLVMLALSGAAVRWFLIAVVAATFTAMPSGVGLDGLARLPLSVINAIVAVAGLVAGVRWLRGAEPRSAATGPPVAVFEQAVPAEALRDGR